MKNTDKTKAQLIQELASLRARVMELERERLRAEMLQNTAQALARSIRHDNSPEVIVDELKRVFDYDAAALLVLESDNTLRIAVMRPDGWQSQEKTGTIYQEGEARRWGFVLGGQIRHLPDAKSAADMVGAPLLTARIGSWMEVPLVAPSEHFGALIIAMEKPNAFAAQDIKVLETFARQAALAIWNAHLIDHLEDSLHKLQETRARLARSEQLALAGEISAGVAHQINNPLMTVIADSHLLLQQLPPDSPYHASIEAIQKAAYRAGGVVQRLLDFTGIKPHEMKPVDINGSILSTVELVRPQLDPEHARLILELAPGLPQVTASDEHLQDVWVNLLLNARGALAGRKDGLITMTSCLSSAHNAIEVTVADNGLGISQEHIDAVLDPFFTTKERGAGLGLAICYDIIKNHGGELSIESVVGAGCVVKIFLPLSKNLA